MSSTAARPLATRRAASSSRSTGPCRRPHPPGHLRQRFPRRRHHDGEGDITCSTEEFTRERSQDLQTVFRNYDLALRPQEKVVEHTRALNAAKLEKIFTRPFIGAMDAHGDGISCMAKNPNHLKGIFSASMDGDVRLWDIASRAADHLWNSNLFATTGAQVDIWDHNRQKLMLYPGIQWSQ